MGRKIQFFLSFNFCSSFVFYIIWVAMDNVLQDVVWQVSPNDRLSGTQEKDRKGENERDTETEIYTERETGRQRQKDGDRGRRKLSQQ